MDEMIIREASIEDKEEVLGIHGNSYEYKGIESLPALYDHYMRCRYTTAYVGMINSQIIAFAVSFLVDGGRTIITRSGRVSPMYRGKGIYSAIRKHVIRQSGATENAFTVTNSNKAVLTNSLQRNHKLVSSKEMYQFMVNPHTVRISEALKRFENTPSNTRQTTKTDLELYMTSDKHRKYLFPDDVMIVDWVPYRLLPSNIPLMGVPGRTYMLTNVDEGNQKGMMSICTCYPTRDPPFTANLELYGFDPRSIQKHIAAHMGFLCRNTHTMVCLLVFFNKCFYGIDIERGFDSLGLKRSVLESVSGFSCSKQLLFRRNIAR